MAWFDRSIRNGTKLRRAVCLGPTLLGVAMIALVWGSLGFYQDVEHSAAERAAIQNSDNLARAFGRHLSDSLDEIDRSLQIMRRSYMLYPDGFDFRDVTHASLLSDGQILQVSIIGPDGFHKLSSTESPSGKRVDLRDREHFRVFVDAVNDELFISKPVIGRTSGKLSIQLARRIHNADGSFGGVLVASVDPSHFARLYGSVDIGPDGFVNIVGTDGIIRVTGGPVSARIGLDLSGANLFEHYRKKTSGWFYTKSNLSDEVPRLLTYRAVEKYPLIITIGVSKAIIFSGVHAKQRTYNGAAAMLTVLILIVTGFGIRGRAVRERMAGQLGVKNLQLNAALENIPQGLSMFDRDRRLVVCNDRYVQMYGMPSELVKSGCSLHSILELRKSAGNFSSDVDQYIADLTERLAEGQTVTLITPLADGRTIVVANHPMTGGGWMAAHEDITDRKRAEADRDRNRALLDMIVEHVPSTIIVKAASDLRYILINRAAESYYGISRDRMVGRKAHDFLLKETADHVGSLDKRVLESYPEPIMDEHALKVPGRDVRIGMSSRYCFVDKNGEPEYLLAVIDDITERRHAEWELDRAKRFLDTVIENVPLPIAIKDPGTSKIILVNRAYEEFYGRPRDAILGKTSSDMFSKENADLIAEYDSQALRCRGEPITTEFQLETRAKGLRNVATTRLVVWDSGDVPQYLIVVINDVTEKKSVEERMAFMAHHDALTGLANRAALVEKLEEACARQRRWGEPFSTLMLDLDRFKAVNDTLGHPAGDALLKEVAARLKSALRETDVLARLGGDEFAIVQTGETNQREAAMVLAGRILEIIARPFEIEGNELSIGTSIGIALAPEHGTVPANLLKMADLALYRVKAEGRNDARFFEPEMALATDARHLLENDLRQAIAQNQLELHYQPIVDMRTRKLCGVEALVRWRHPQKGLVFSDQFIPLAEETGLINQIGAWVLQTACADAQTWPIPVKVAVNLSPAQFRKSNLVDIVICALAESGLPPERLELEITETAIFDGGAECVSVLRQFKNLGIAIALDDFGTGYSSLSQLTMFPFDKIKIDKSFTRDMTRRADSAAIIAATLTLAHSLDIATTAEGVETAEQFKLLKLAGVSSVQGYLFKRPCRIAEIDFNAIYGDREMQDAA